MDQLFTSNFKSLGLIDTNFDNFYGQCKNFVNEFESSELFLLNFSHDEDILKEFDYLIACGVYYN